MSKDNFDKMKRWNECPLDKRIEGYSEYLKDGDFEKYQQAAYMDKSSDEYLILKKDALAEFVRAGWIMSRFTEFMSDEWWKYAELTQGHYRLLRIMLLDKRLEKWNND